MKLPSEIQSIKWLLELANRVSGMPSNLHLPRPKSRASRQDLQNDALSHATYRNIEGEVSLDPAVSTTTHNHAERTLPQPCRCTT